MQPDGTTELQTREREEEPNILSEPFRVDDVPCTLLVNGILVRSVQTQRVTDTTDDFQVVIEDPQIGSFSLHGGFDLEMRAHATWEPVTLEQLKKTLAAREFLHAEDMPKVSETLERKLFDRLDDVDVPHRRSPRVAELTGHDECVRRVRKLLYEARIPHRVAGTVFVVPSVRRTRMVLSSAGFYPSPIAPAALVEPLTRCAIQLSER